MLSPLRVLFAEDHPLMRESIIGLLSQHCIIAGTVDRGDAVVAAVEELQPDAVVMDISMPGRSGLQVLPELRSAYPQLAIILLTSHDSDLYRKEGSKRGADGYVLKGQAASELWSTLELAVAQRTSSGHAIAVSF